MTNFITRRRTRFSALCGDVNIPYGTNIPVIENYLTYHDLPLCVTTSENSHTYFCGNDDGQGKLRGQLIETITKTLQKQDKNHQSRWNRIWADDIANKYRKKEFDDYFLWGHDFYEANVEDLQHIAELVKE